MKYPLILSTIAAVATIAISSYQTAAQDPFGKDPAPDWVKPSYSTASKVFRVGKVGQPGASAMETRAKLLALHAAMSDRKAEVFGIEMELTVKQGIKTTRGMVYFCDWNGTRIAVLSSDTNIVDGGTLSGTFERNGIYEGETVMGAATRMPQYKQCEDQVVNAPTKEELVKKLKAGQTFTVKMMEPTGCDPCFGRGKLSALQGGTACPACGGSGKALVTYTLKWE